MPDPYWEQVGKDIKKKQKELQKSSSAIRCTTCNKLFLKHEERPQSRDPWVCGSCAGQNPLTRRGKSSEKVSKWDEGADSPWGENARRIREGD